MLGPRTHTGNGKIAVRLYTIALALIGSSVFYAAGSSIEARSGGELIFGVAYASEASPLNSATGQPAPQEQPEPSKSDGTPIPAVPADPMHASAPPTTALPAETGPPQSNAVTTTTAGPDLVMRGDFAFAVGNVAAARELYQLGADAGDAKAALHLAETFDERFLTTINQQSQADPARAVHWYRRASELGSEFASFLLNRIERADPTPAGAASTNPPPAEEVTRPAAVSNTQQPAEMAAKPIQAGSVDTASTSNDAIRALWASLEPYRNKLELWSHLATSHPSASANAPATADRATQPASAVASVPAPAAKPIRRPSLTADELAMLLARGDSLLGTGDVSAARLFYERGAIAGDGTAALRLGETFDPKFLARAHLGIIVGDEGRSTYWYRVARDLGNNDVAVLLDSNR